MQEIYWAPIVPMGSGTEYYLGQRELCENGSYWNGNVFNYVFNKIDYDCACSSVNAEYDGIISNLPKNSVVLAVCEKPIVAYWTEE